MFNGFVLQLTILCCFCLLIVSSVWKIMHVVIGRIVGNLKKTWFGFLPDPLEALI